MNSRALPLSRPVSSAISTPVRRGQAAQRLVMLAGEDFGRCQQRRLRAGLDRDQHGFERHDRLARADIALQQPQHRRALRHVAFDLADRARLRAGQREGQLQLGPQTAVAFQRLPLARAVGVAHQHQREAVGQQFVISQPIARCVCSSLWASTSASRQAGHFCDRAGPARSIRAARAACASACCHQPGDARLGQPFGQAR